MNSSSDANTSGASGPLTGIRVADFSVHAAGPFAGLMLAEMGAQVIKVESSARLPDITRRPHTMYGKPPSSFEQINANKMSVCLNLKEPKAVELALELVSASEMALENFRPGVMQRLGLGYEAMKEVRPDIILVSLSSNGQTGPESNYAGYAPMFAALGGLGHLTGYSDGAARGTAPCHGPYRRNDGCFRRSRRPVGPPAHWHGAACRRVGPGPGNVIHWAGAA